MPNVQILPFCQLAPQVKRESKRRDCKACNDSDFNDKSTRPCCGHLNSCKLSTTDKLVMKAMSKLQIDGEVAICKRLKASRLASMQIPAESVCCSALSKAKSRPVETWLSDMVRL